MVFPRMDLTHHAAYPRTIASDNDEKVLGNKSHLFIDADEFNMREPLAIGTYLILAFYNKDTSCFQCAIGLTASISV